MASSSMSSTAASTNPHPLDISIVQASWSLHIAACNSDEAVAVNQVVSFNWQTMQWPPANVWHLPVDELHCQPDEVKRRGPCHLALLIQFVIDDQHYI